MSFYNLVRTALYSIRAYKLRIFLTMIGIIIGISSVSAILAIGEGLKVEATSSIEEANLNKITINYTPSSSSAGNEVPFEEDQIPQIELIEGVKSVDINDDSNQFFNFNILEAKYFDQSIPIDIKNYDSQYPKLNIVSGRDMSKEERDSSRKVIMITKQDAELLFEDMDEAIGKGIAIGGDVYEVIGITEGLDMDTGFNFGPPPDFDLMAAVVPQGIDLSEEEESDEIRNIGVGIGSERDKDEVLEDVKEKLHELNPDLEGEYTSFDMQEILEEMQGIINNITKFVAFVTGISLLVGGIGVMNIMYVSVTERKREIGIRRAIGAKPRSILMQFLMEAIFITGLGGLIGIGSGYLLSLLIGSFLPFEPVMTISNFIGASSISVLTGLVFGIIPASKAAKLDPIVAIYK